MGVIHGLGWIFLLLASVIAPRAWQERPAGAQALRWRERWQWWSYGDFAERAAFRQTAAGPERLFLAGGAGAVGAGLCLGRAGAGGVRVDLGAGQVASRLA